MAITGPYDDPLPAAPTGAPPPVAYATGTRSAGGVGAGGAGGMNVVDIAGHVRARRRFAFAQTARVQLQMAAL